ncbi:hypothetical protein [Streptomyces sp. NBC_00080]|uniref:hypothetical protein n=1 Tax=Streptomyces sp. NBC_00080 TaxID=2975645 RepID=UPI003869FF82
MPGPYTGTAHSPQTCGFDQPEQLLAGAQTEVFGHIGQDQPALAARPQVPPGTRPTSRCPRRTPPVPGRRSAGVAYRGRTVVRAARDFEVSWPVANTAFTAAAEAVLPKDTPPVTRLGIDETRRGKAKFRRDT